MKKLFPFVIALLSFGLQAQIVNIPDANFKTALLNYQPAIDTNSDGEIQVSEAQSVTVLDVSNKNISDLTGISSFANLTTLFCAGNNFSNLTLSGLPVLEIIDCSNNTVSLNLNLSGLVELKRLGCYHNTMTAISLSLPALEEFNFAQNTNLSSLDVSALTNLKTLNCNGSNLTSLTVAGLSHLENLFFDYNNITTIDLSGLVNLKQFSAMNGVLSSLNVAPCSSLEILSCSSNQLTSLDLTALTHLKGLFCNANQLTYLNLSNSLDLEALQCGGNQLTSLNVSQLTNLHSLVCGNNLLTTLDINSLLNLTDLECGHNLLTQLPINNLVLLTQLNFGNPGLNAVDVSSLTNLTNLTFYNGLQTTLNLTNQTQLTQLAITDTQLTELDISNSPALFNLYINNNPNLTYLNAKNGGLLGCGIRYCPNLNYICADENKVALLTQALIPNTNNNANVVINSYCNFVPGGVHNTITGQVTLDSNFDGCAANDPHPLGIRININDGTISGGTFTNAAGDYTFYASAGNFLVSPDLENNYFTINPAATTLNFPATDASAQTLDFCITPLGIHYDVEIVIIPVRNARPGFNAEYKIIYKNKGNQILSGNIDFAFDDAVLDFISANPTIAFQTLNHLNWNYTDLLPFESRSIDVTLYLNSPQETPAVNVGDYLHYVATISTNGQDESPADTVFTLDQLVRGSLDPNDKTCLEGNTIRPERIGDYLHYVIRFQNTGTDYAQNVVVKDLLDTTKFDVSSLQLTTTSHPCTTKITGDKAEFIFENINLPAVAVDEPASHGYVAFKIKTKNNLVLGNSISNTADIYFDYNFPVTTNTTNTTVSLLAVNQFENKSVTMLPNPVKDQLTISAKDEITSVQLLDEQGRILETKLNASNQATLNVNGKAKGIYFVKVFTTNGMKTQKIIKN